jgi:hypothetical protein
MLVNPTKCRPARIWGTHKPARLVRRVREPIDRPFDPQRQEPLMPARHPLRLFIAALAAAALLATAFAGAAAQDVASTPALPDRPSYPVSIHAGTCDDPTAQPIGPTLDTEVAGLDDGERIGISDEPPVLAASGTVDGSLDDLTGTPHVVAIHASAEDYGTIVACGEIAGYAEDGRLVFALRSVDGSDVSGIAILDDQPSFLDEVLSQLDLDFGGGKLSLTVLVVAGEAEGA